MDTIYEDEDESIDESEDGSKYGSIDKSEDEKSEGDKNAKGDAKGNANEDVEVYCIGVCKYDENEPTKIEYEYYEDLRIMKVTTTGKLK